MQRRNFLKQGLAATAGAGLSRFLAHSPAQSRVTAGKAFRLNYAIHAGMFKHHAGPDFTDQIKFAYEQGFRSIEDNGMMKRPPAEQQKIGDSLAKLGMTMGVFVVDKGGNSANTLAAGKQEHIDIFLKGCRDAIETAKRVNARWVTVVPGDYERKLPIGIQTANVVEALRRGAAILEPHNIIMVLEPLSDTPDLFLRYSDQTYEICKAVGSPSCKLLFDIYHMQRNEGNIINNINRTWDEIAYIQVGDNPGRKEPTTGEVNYKNVFKAIAEKGYKGVIGMEHGNSKPDKEGELAVIRAYRECDEF